MKMKRISAANMKDAMTLARRELGEDVVLIDTHKTAGGVIVTFAIDQEDEDFGFEQAAEIAERTTPFRPAIQKPATSKVEIDHPAHVLLKDVMEYHSISSGLSARILEHALRIPSKPDSLIDVAENALTQSLTSNIRFNPIVTNSGILPQRALMLVGPHGAGKTSTIAKLATQLTLQKKPVHLISTDTERLGGTESLQLLANMLKCPFTVGENRAHLKSLLTQTHGKAWVLIDSAGANIYEFAPLKALGEFASLQGVEPILTCPAGLDAAEAIEMASVFNFINIERMLITRLDAVRRLGSAFGALTTGGYALANYTNSAIPTDACYPMTASALAHLMLRYAREKLTHEPKRSHS
jgi:flagellar biosynthesis protein FlhF